ncbi:ABC transporter permease [Polyangium sp. 15x6]|uniref:ABC transporter permease n=1 Tax=Polyangium sp. 15x6 TaxID=3042687 RepID=UPI002499BCE8|nr:ABC transporter permease [Polyangium sp. 15x6]MDI3288319.1 ABC transporter permease [Polyangium sp. 15x6]
MRMGDLLRALGAVFAARTRAALTLLGIVIGTGSIVLLASLLHAGEAALLHASQEAVDGNLIEVGSAEVPRKDRDKTQRPLSRADADEIGQAAPLAGAAVGSEGSRQTTAHFEGRKKKVSLVSVTPSALALYRLAVARGRFVNEGDVQERRRVCVVGDEVWAKLIMGDKPLEDVQILVGGHLFEVVGVLGRKPLLGATTSTDIWNRKVLIPETTYDALFSPTHEVKRIHVRKPSVAAPMEVLRAVIDQTLFRRHHGARNYELVEEKGKEQERLILGVIQALVLATGAIALFVGGINIMNIMLVTVTERTREIGIRRAVGATPRVILVQFLIESGALALLGGLLGVGVGLVLALLSALALQGVFGIWAFYADVKAILLGLGAAVATGLVFGLYPAWRAARLNPIEALRWE